MHIDMFGRYWHYFWDSTYSFKGHRHNTLEINIVLKGCLELTCGDSVFRLSPGDMAIWKPGIFHMCRTAFEGITELISFHFWSSEAEEVYTGHTASVFQLSESDLSLVHVLDEEVLASLDNVSRAASCLLEALLLRINGKNTIPVLSSHKNSSIYHDAVRIMTENIGASMDAADIAKNCGVCLTSLKKAFAECAGKGVKAYFLDMKIEKAKELLLRGMPSEEVASMLGFSSPAYFSQCFKRETGYTASEFKKRRSGEIIR